jgi:hypothetical protein
MLAMMIVATWVGTAGVVIGSVSVQGGLSGGHVLLGAGLFSYALVGVGATLLWDQTGPQRGKFEGRVWFGLPRLAWIILGIGFLTALGEVAFALMPSMTPT